MERRDKNGLTEKEFLATYRPKDYDRPSVTADIAVFSMSREGLRVLLVRRGGHPYLGYWALPGGFAQKGESVDETAARELGEETHLQGLPLVQVGLFSRPGRDPRMWVVSEAYAAVIPPDRAGEAAAGDDADDARWFDLHIDRRDTRLRLEFSSGEESFSAELEEVSGAFPWELRPLEFRLTNPGELAFDHGEILAHAIHKIGLI